MRLFLLVLVNLDKLRRLNAKIEAFEKKHKRTVFVITLSILILALFLSLYRLFLGLCGDDMSLCLQDYNNDTSLCYSKCLSYWANQRGSQCYVTSNETYLPKPNAMKTRTVDAYLINTNISDSGIKQTINGMNTIWNVYGFNFSIESVNNTFSKENESFDGLETDPNRITERLQQHYDFSSSIEKGHIILVFSDMKNPYFGGIHLPNITGVFVASNYRNTSWATSHEAGHILNLWDKPYYSGEINLMTHGGCIRDNFYPTNLNEKQYEMLPK